MTGSNMYLHMVMVSDRTGNSKWTAEAKLQNRATGSCGQKDEIQTGTHAATILPLPSVSTDLQTTYFH